MSTRKPSIEQIPPQFEQFNILPFKGKFYNPKVSGEKEWKPYQTRPFPRKLLTHNYGNLGVVLGKYEEGYKPSKKAEGLLNTIFGEEAGSLSDDYREYYLVQVDIDKADLYPYFQDVETLTVRTGREDIGYHLFLISTDPIRTKKDYPVEGIEVRSIGSLCPIPPSKHPDTGRRYKVIKDVPILEVKNAYQFTTDRIPPELNPRQPQELEYKDNSKGKHKFKHGEGRVLSQKNVDNIIFILKDYYQEGYRDQLVFSFSGWLRKAGIGEEIAITITEALTDYTEDEEKENRVIVCKRAYEKEDVKTLLGSSGVKEVMKTIDPTDWVGKFMVVELILDGKKPWHDLKQAKEILRGV